MRGVDWAGAWVRIQCAVGDLRRALRSVVWYHLWFVLLQLAVLAPLTGWMGNQLLAVTGRPLVSNYDLLALALTPSGALLLLILGSLHLGLLYLQHAGLLVFAIHRILGGATTPVDVLRRSLPRFPELIRLGLWQLPGYGMVLLPCGLALWWIHEALLAGHDINYHLAFQTREWRFARVLALVVAILGGVGCAWLYLRWVFALAEVVYRRRHGRLALIRSWRLTSGSWVQIGLPLAVWWLVFGGMIVAGSVLFRPVSVYLLDAVGSRLGIAVPVIVGLLGMSLLGAFVSALVVLGGHQFLVARLFLDCESGITAQRVLRKETERDTAVVCWRWVRWLVPVAVIVAQAIVLLHVRGLDMSVNTRVTAHRGSSIAAPENTLAAIRQSIEDGADEVEIDVQTTKDGRVVVLHDADLMRVSGDPRRVADLTFVEIRELDVGSWMDPRFAGERVPTLEEVIELTRGRIGLHVELKYNWADPELARRTVAILRQAGVVDRCVVSSLRQSAVEEMKRIAPEFRVGLIVTRAMGRTANTSADFLSLNARQVNRALVRALQKRGVEVAVWTVNEERLMMRMLLMGVDDIITDEPARLRRLIEELNELSVLERLVLEMRALLPGGG